MKPKENLRVHIYSRNLGKSIIISKWSESKIPRWCSSHVTSQASRRSVCILLIYSLFASKCVIMIVTLTWWSLKRALKTSCIATLVCARVYGMYPTDFNRSNRFHPIQNQKGKQSEMEKEKSSWLWSPRKTEGSYWLLWVSFHRICCISILHEEKVKFGSGFLLMMVVLVWSQCVHNFQHCRHNGIVSDGTCKR